MADAPGLKALWFRLFWIPLEQHVPDVDGRVAGVGLVGEAGSYNIPQAFSRRGASEKGIAGSAKLGYELTSAGKKELNRTPDKMIE